MSAIFVRLDKSFMLGVLALKAAVVFSYVYFGWIYGERLGRGRTAGGRWLVGALVLLAVQSLWQTVFYYLSLPLGSFTDALSLALAVICLGPLVIKTHVKEPDEKNTEQPAWLWIIATILPAALCALYVIRGAWLATTLDPIRTPWPLLPAPTLAAFALIGLAGLLAAWKTRVTWPVICISALGLVSILSIAPLIYANGFGFDGFLHRASMDILSTTGTLSPKPPYYMGLYVLETWFARLLSIPIVDIDRWLMLVSLILLPIGISWTTRDRNKANWMLAASLLVIPLAPFVVTTPQAFAYLIGFLAITSALGRLHPITTLSLAAWSLAIHPLAGLPFFLITLALMARERAWLAAPLVIAAGISVPAAFALLGVISNNQVTWDLTRLLDIDAIRSVLNRFQPPSNRVALWADAAALMEVLQLPIMFLASIFAIWKSRDDRRESIILFSSATLFVIAGLVLQAAGEFPFLIDYERGNYADRLFVIASLMLLIPALGGIGRALARIPRLGLAPALLLLALIPAGISANAYTALPRHDAANVSRGWSVGRADIEAARWIDRDATGSPYTVLANQSVSAAAVQELGFKRYAGDVFFYPIPTGGPLYQKFLDIMDINSNIDPVREAARLGQTKLVYVVLNDYWWDASKVAEHLSAMADRQESFRDNRVRVYRFEIN
jgi:hypothetical protein